MLSTAEAKFLSKSATFVMALHMRQYSMYVCGCLMGRAAFKEHLSAKESRIF